MQSTLIRRRSGRLDSRPTRPVIRPASETAASVTIRTCRAASPSSEAGRAPAPGPRPARSRRRSRFALRNAIASSTDFRSAVRGAGANHLVEVWNSPRANRSRSVRSERNRSTAQSAACHLAPDIEPEWSTSRTTSRGVPWPGSRVAGGRDHRQEIDEARGRVVVTQDVERGAIRGPFGTARSGRNRGRGRPRRRPAGPVAWPRRRPRPGGGSGSRPGPRRASSDRGRIDGRGRGGSPAAALRRAREPASSFRTYRGAVVNGIRIDQPAPSDRASWMKVVSTVTS